tara:strand:+ start:1845 stop:2165 length:321 start_codon:yes stop_codon:yes gene_type:complete
MSQKNTQIIKDLVIFYVKENYDNYLQTNNLSSIPTDKIGEVVSTIYTNRKSHLKEFLKKSLKEIMKEEYLGDLAVQSICNEIFLDDEFCKQRLITEINMYQNKNLK